MTMLSTTFAPEVMTLWRVALGVGAVVVVVVIALLTLLLKIVEDIDVGVRRVWEAATRVAANTATTWQLEEAALAAEALDDELSAHESILEEP